jgi:hypothetical protein
MVPYYGTYGSSESALYTKDEYFNILLRELDERVYNLIINCMRRLRGDITLDSLFQVAILFFGSVKV